ncbi:MAG: nucleoside deaminase [Bacteroidota bacterium]
MEKIPSEEERSTYFMREVIALAMENVRSGAGGPFGALVVKDGEIIARGRNLVTSTNDPTAHAEVVAIRRACQNLNTYQLSDCDLYSSCEPCPMCLGAIYWARPRYIYFGAFHSDAAKAGFDDQFIYQELSRPRDQRSIPMVQLLAEEAWAPFKAWQEKVDRRLY